MLLSPIPGMLTIPNPHVLRSITVLVIFTYLVGLGVVHIWKHTEIAAVLLGAFALEAAVLLGGYFADFGTATRAWYEADMVEAFENTLPMAEEPYIISQSLYPGTSVGTKFIYVQEGGVGYVDGKNVVDSVVIDMRMHENVLREITQGTVFLTNSECSRYQPILSSYYTQIWSAAHSCAWERN